MVSVDKAQIAKYKFEGNNFEILIDSNLAMQMKQGKSVSINEILAVNKIFKDAKKGLEASTEKIKQIFKTDNPAEVARIIIEKGVVPVTAEYRNSLREQKRKQVVAYFQKYAVDPQTHLPHPATRIENAMAEAKVNIDEKHDIPKLVEEVKKKIMGIIPIKFEMKEVAIKIPADYAAKSYKLVQSLGKMLKDEWLSDGSWTVVLEIPGGMEEEMHSKLNSMCHGNVETKILKIK